MINKSTPHSSLQPRVTVGVHTNTRMHSHTHKHLSAFGLPTNFTPRGNEWKVCMLWQHEAPDSTVVIFLTFIFLYSYAIQYSIFLLNVSLASAPTKHFLSFIFNGQQHKNIIRMRLKPEDVSCAIVILHCTQSDTNKTNIRQI